MSKRFSLEFFPPKTIAGREKLRGTLQQLDKLKPDFYSVTYGAGGSTRDNTIGVIEEMREAGIDVAPHLSFGGDSDTEMSELLDQYRRLGVKRLVALRGDIPSGTGISRLVYANELVEFIRRHSGNHFEIEVAAYPEIHPEAEHYDSDIDFLKQKFRCGADSAITQYFFNADAYFYFMERCQQAGIEQPIYPGVMPITNFSNLCRFSANCGAEIPRWLKQRVDSFGDDQQAIEEWGVEFISRLSERLLAGGAPGIHFYTMNQVEPTRSIWNNLGLSR
ncbi:5,10-methylenetetrahydrofolate reductase (NAD(P)) [Sinobacterium caligoides]|uniref:Methylenetetrahydrofolate reductase n=1 Tax=Sinobacterium caligoides TaxID=933926 RepID=A0A3N2DHP9_9GAMM|nr:methylenetetrahydrofolate reductase [NAD(P)H] [Sinobacterium caligoides]ROR98914.1 5,10-methylenetetrahydrofolate reductase (NAD(P)) [Sinobacterium caligoides]